MCAPWIYWAHRPNRLYLINSTRRPFQVSWLSLSTTFQAFLGSTVPFGSSFVTLRGLQEMTRTPSGSLSHDSHAVVFCQVPYAPNSLAISGWLLLTRSPRLRRGLCHVHFGANLWRRVWGCLTRNPHIRWFLLPLPLYSFTSSVNSGRRAGNNILLNLFF